MSEIYSVVVESGSCSPDYKRWEEREHCGHAHKTIEAADRCREKLTRWYCERCGKTRGCTHGQRVTSGKWWGATIHNQHGERISR